MTFPPLSTTAGQVATSSAVALALEAETAESFRLTRKALLDNPELPAMIRSWLTPVLAPLLVAGMHVQYPDKCECTLDTESRMTHTYTVLIGDTPGVFAWHLRVHVVLVHYMSFAQTDVHAQLLGLDRSSGLWKDYPLQEATSTLQNNGREASALSLIFSRFHGELPGKFATAHIAADLLDYCTP